MLSRDLTHQLNTAIQFLVECRPLSVSMGNAIKFVKLQACSGLLLECFTCACQWAVVQALPMYSLVATLYRAAAHIWHSVCSLL